MLCVILAVVAQAYNVWVGGDFIFGYGSRFVVPTLPFLLLLGVRAVHAAGPRLLYAVAPALLLYYGLNLFAQPPGIERTRNNGHQLERTLAFEDDLECKIEMGAIEESGNRTFEEMEVEEEE